MTDAKSAWNDTGEQLTALSAKLGAHYENQRGAEGREARAQTEEAIKRLGDAVRDAFDAVGAAARDDAVRQDVKQVGRSLVTALDVTFQEVSKEVRKVFDRPSAGSPGPEPKPGPEAGPGAGGAAAPEAKPAPEAGPSAEGEEPKGDA
jgi:hypothetical protein